MPGEGSSDTFPPDNVTANDLSRLCGVTSSVISLSVGGQFILDAVFKTFSLIRLPTIATKFSSLTAQHGLL